jgi:hypothetical protein
MSSSLPRAAASGMPGLSTAGSGAGQPTGICAHASARLLAQSAARRGGCRRSGSRTRLAGTTSVTWLTRPVAGRLPGGRLPGGRARERRTRPTAIAWPAPLVTITFHSASGSWDAAMARRRAVCGVIAPRRLSCPGSAMMPASVRQGTVRCSSPVLAGPRGSPASAPVPEGASPAGTCPGTGRSGQVGSRDRNWLPVPSGLAGPA